MAKRYSKSAQDVIDGAVAWALAIASDNSFHYGKAGPSSHNQGCYFCGTNKASVKTGIKQWQKTYCCNPFVHACFAHGGGEPTMLRRCRNGGSFDFHYKNKYGYQAHPNLFARLGHPPMSELKKGDVLCRETHVAMYIGNGYIIHARGGDNNIPGSARWNNSISATPLTAAGYANFPRAYRYIGKGGGVMEQPPIKGSLKNAFIRGDNKIKDTPDSVIQLFANGIYDYPVGSDAPVEDAAIADSGAGLNMQQAISKLYSSDNYEYVYQEEKSNKSKELASRFTDKIQSALNSLDFSSLVTDGSSAIKERIVTTALEESEFEKDKPKIILQGKSSQLLSYPTWVQAPTIVLDFNGIKIGGYNNSGDLYPNYITSMSVDKVNGRINKYTINLTYQVRPGEDPNFIDKLISRVGYTNPLKILYGDSNYPSSYYREESAIITDARNSEDVSSYRINYTINALSSISASQSSLITFKDRQAKPSTVIYDVLYSSGDISKQLLNIFPGMRNRALVSSKMLIPTNDSVVNIGGMENVSPMTYISYLVACMNNDATSSSYYLNIVDNSYDELGGTYFEIKEVINYNNQNMTNINVGSNYFELDIGYPSNNYITNFEICKNDYWSLVYKYAGSLPKFEYGIDDNGNIVETQSNMLFIGNRYNESNLISSNWWSHVTEFPITAKVTLKGLISPVILLSYIKVNAMFYGQKDMASGLYVVTQQEDSISGSGYSTTLTLLRVAGD